MIKVETTSRRCAPSESHDTSASPTTSRSGTAARPAAGRAGRRRRDTARRRDDRRPAHGRSPAGRARTPDLPRRLHLVVPVSHWHAHAQGLAAKGRRLHNVRAAFQAFTLQHAAKQARRLDALMCHALAARHGPAMSCCHSMLCQQEASRCAPTPVAAWHSRAHVCTPDAKWLPHASRRPQGLPHDRGRASQQRRTMASWPPRQGTLRGAPHGGHSRCAAPLGLRATASAAACIKKIQS